MTTTKKLLLLDLSGIFWANWHATAGSDVDAAFRSSYAKVQQMQTGFDAVIICCDSGSSFRKEIYPAYKANRPPKEQAPMDQLRRLQERLVGDSYIVARADNFEADDVIATLACQAPSAGYEVAVGSSDKDMCALVGPAVSIVQPGNGEMLGPDGVFAKLGVRPDQVTDYLALVGDASDNIKGAPGIGPKTAAALLAKCGTIEAVYTRIDELRADGIIGDKQRAGLLESREAVELARKVVSLRLDAPVSLVQLLKEPEPAPELEEQEEEEKRPPVNLATTTPQKDADTKAPAEEPPPAALVLDKSDPRWSMVLEPGSAGQAWKFAQALYRSQLYRKFPNAEAIFAVIMRGRSMGIDMMSALDGFHVLDGKPTASSNLLIACVLNSGKAEYFELVETTIDKATWVTKRKGGRREVSLTFSIADAERAGLVRKGGNWEKHPRAMCRKQAGAELARAVYPDVCANVYTPEEMGGDIDTGDIGKRVA